MFWVSVFGVAYSYFLYPLLLLSMPRRRERWVVPGALPRISLILAAYNEAHQIRTKLENSLALDYPSEQLEVLVASDASDDGTDEIVAEYAVHGVRLVRAQERRGKEWAQLLAAREATGEILVFSDVATMIAPDALRQLAVDFSDPRVGAVSSEDRFIAADGQMVGEGLYVRYEMWLRRLESGVSGLVGLSGSFFAARRNICERWDVSAPSDFNTALNCVRMGYVAISDPRLLGYYSAIQDEQREYQRKLRTVLRGITGLMRQPGVLNPLRFGFFSVQVFSHKLMRWLVPWFLLLLFIASVGLAGTHWFYSLALVGQIAFYLLVVAGVVSARLRQHALVKVPYFFMQVNIAIAHACIAFLRGRRIRSWQPSKR